MPISLLLSLIPIFSDLTAGGSIGAALSSITIAEWATIAVQALAAGPEVTKLLGLLHPALDTLVSEINTHKNPDLAAHVVDKWFANQPPTISGYGPDGGVTEIPNPDYRG